MMRTQFPIVAGFALTVNKAQGLTLKEGVVIHLVGGARFRPAAKHGLPFVAWTAFKKLPAWSDFERGRDSDMLRRRNAFIENLWDRHRETLRRHTVMSTPEKEAAAHRRWTLAQATDARATPKTHPRLPCPGCATRVHRMSD